MRQTECETLTLIANRTVVEHMHCVCEFVCVWCVVQQQLTQHQRWPVGYPRLQALMENLMQEHDGLAEEAV